MVASDFYTDSSDEESEYRRLHPRVAGYFDGTYGPRSALAERAMFVAECDGTIVGFIAGHRSTRMGCNAELQWLFVLPDRQRQRIATQLLSRLREWFVEQRCTRVIVDVSPENPARAFYLKRGAIPLDKYWLHWPDVSRDLA